MLRTLYDTSGVAGVDASQFSATVRRLMLNPGPLLFIGLKYSFNRIFV